MPDFSTSLSDGDFVMANGDFATLNEGDAMVRDVAFRLKTGLFDYEPFPMLGAGLEEFRGEPNTRSLGGAIERAIIRALTFDGKYPPDSISVMVVPLGIHTMGAYIFMVPRILDSTFSKVRFSITIDLNVGDITQITGEAA